MTATVATEPTIYDFLAEGERTAEEVLAAIPKAAVSRSWVCGHIEVGRVARIQTGNARFDMAASGCIIEGTTEWCVSGPGIVGGIDRVLEDAVRLPVAGRYSVYESVEDVISGEKQVEKVAITEAQARELVSVVTIRLSEKGRAKLAGEPDLADLLAKLAEVLSKGKR